MFRKKYSGRSYRNPGLKKKTINTKSYKKYHFNLHFMKIDGFVLGVKDFLLRYWLIGGIIIGLSFFLVFIIILVNDYQTIKGLTHFKPKTITYIYDKNEILISELFEEKRASVPLKKIPKNLINAFIAMEDNDFYDHMGVNPKAIVRAFFINLRYGRIKQGGSTITQQLTKILLTSRKRNIFRKIKEAVMSLVVDWNFSKEKILELYLNQIFLGHGAYGVDVASQIYFFKIDDKGNKIRKHVWELNLAECALLAALPSSPNRYSPLRNPELASRMQKMALAKMVNLGFITIKEANEAYYEFWPDYLYMIRDVSPSTSAWSLRKDRAPWFTEYIRRKLVDKYGEDKVYNEGLKIYTTLDIKKQEAAQRILSEALENQSKVSNNLSFKNEDYIVDNYLSDVEMFSYFMNLNSLSSRGSRINKKINKNFQNEFFEELEAVNFLAGIEPVDKFCTKYHNQYFKGIGQQDVEAALISINQRNGYIETMIGGNRFTQHNQLNRTLQSKRQPGSSIKPLLYSAALESGRLNVASTILDSPRIFLDNDGGDWIPENYEGEYYGLLRLRRALKMSINVISIQIAEIIGIDMVLNYYGRFLKLSDEELKKRIPRNFSIALGSFEVSPYEMASAYAAIANGGREVIPYAIRYITVKKAGKDVKIFDNEKIIAEKRKNLKQVIKPATAQLMISLLKSVVSGGTGISANAGRPTCGKTGTTNNFLDAWFVGFTPELTTCLWMGFDSQGYSLGMGQSGGAVAAPAWGKYMRAALKGYPVRNFPTYAKLTELEVCADSGKLSTDKCPNVIKEVFIPEFVPKEECDLDHTNAEIENLNIKGPKEDILKKQNKDILNKIRKGKKGSSILDSVGDDLLE